MGKKAIEQPDVRPPISTSPEEWVCVDDVYTLRLYVWTDGLWEPLFDLPYSERNTRIMEERESILRIALEKYAAAVLANAT